MTPSSAPSLKRRAASPGCSDSENVDPNILDSLHKRKRSTFDDDVSLSKPRYSLSTMSSAPKRRLDTPIVSTPRLNTLVKSSTTPASAPAAAAGRSPVRKRQGGLLQSRKRPAPPPFGTKSPALSISAALSGTLANRKSKKPRSSTTIEDSKPKSWFFDIFEESEETQDYRMNEWTMTQSAYGLDISDDESKAKERLDRGKENIDPDEISVPVTRSMTAAASTAKPRISRKDKDAMLDDEPRMPLGDLNPAKFYAEGLDATSVILVQDDTPETEVEAVEEQVIDPKSQPEFTFSTTASLSLSTKAIEALETPSIDQILGDATSNWDSTLKSSAPTTIALDSKVEIPEPQDIEIWESQSAKDENEKPEFEVLADYHSPKIPTDEENVFALQEL